MAGGLLVAGTTSDAGKSVVAAGICRWLHRQGVKVAPFKAQNMSNNSVVVLDPDGSGGEIGRAQALQAAACGLTPSVRFNPVLLKPGSDRSSQVVLLGTPIGSVSAATYEQVRARTREAALAAFAELRGEYDVVVCEGAGSPAEINLRAGDFVNMGLARAFDLPTVIVGDIDRGGVLAAFYGTLAMLDRQDQALVTGFIVNKFRGDPSLLAPGLETLARRTGRPTYGVLPWQPDLWLDAEDSLAYGSLLGRPRPPLGRAWLRVAVVRLPRLSNATDAEALAAEPGVLVRLTTDPGDLVDVDLVILPGSKSTVDDLDWLRRTGLARAVVAHAAAGRPLLGICGGFQMLAEHIHDHVESRRGSVDGLGVLPIEVTFTRQKTLARPSGMAFGAPVAGYEIHHGQVSGAPSSLEPLIWRSDGCGEGVVRDNVAGTHWHGAFESDDFRRAFLAETARRAGRRGFVVAPDTNYAALRERTIDLLGDIVEAHLDTQTLLRLVDQGASPDLPIVASSLVASSETPPFPASP
ncbi:MAG: cobyric acid synthase [Dactylosporangium sp.]|nr:cobyric acid synthase [Dactylosporangium sp.]NNJ60273.1 cobyric acid synthase [Dactylosporangium sp.]